MNPIDPTLITRRLDDGTLIRHEWGDGQERACLLAALAPETAQQNGPSACPASVMPLWLAELTPWIDDAGSDAAWPATVRRYAAVAARWHVLDDEAWAACERDVKIACIEEAVSHVTVDEWGVRNACGRVIAALCGRGDMASARADAVRAAVAVASVAATAAEAAVQAAVAEAASAAAQVAWSAQVAAAATWVAAEQAKASAADRITDRILSILEDACTAAERAS